MHRTGIVKYNKQVLSGGGGEELLRVSGYLRRTKHLQFSAPHVTDFIHRSISSSTKSRVCLIQTVQKIFPSPRKVNCWWTTKWPAFSVSTRKCIGSILHISYTLGTRWLYNMAGRKRYIELELNLYYHKTCTRSKTWTLCRHKTYIRSTIIVITKRAITKLELNLCYHKTCTSYVINYTLFAIKKFMKAFTGVKKLETTKLHNCHIDNWQLQEIDG